VCVFIYLFLFLKFEVCSIDSSEMMCKFLEVLSFNRLFLILNECIWNRLSPCIDCVDAWPWLDVHLFELVPTLIIKVIGALVKNMFFIKIEVYWSCGKKPSGGCGNGPKFGTQWKLSMDVMWFGSVSVSKSIFNWSPLDFKWSLQRSQSLALVGPPIETSHVWRIIMLNIALLLLATSSSQLGPFKWTWGL